MKSQNTPKNTRQHPDDVMQSPKTSAKRKPESVLDDNQPKKTKKKYYSAWHATAQKKLSDLIKKINNEKFQPKQKKLKVKNLN